MLYTLDYPNVYSFTNQGWCIVLGSYPVDAHATAYSQQARDKLNFA